MNELQIKQAYQVAKERYAAIGINTDNALERLQNIKISVHCWQGDDVRGFLTPDGELTGASCQRGITQVLLKHQISFAKTWKRPIA